MQEFLQEYHQYQMPPLLQSEFIYDGLPISVDSPAEYSAFSVHAPSYTPAPVLFALFSACQQWCISPEDTLGAMLGDTSVNRGDLYRASFRGTTIDIVVPLEHDRTRAGVDNFTKQLQTLAAAHPLPIASMERQVEGHTVYLLCENATGLRGYQRIAILTNGPLELSDALFARASRFVVARGEINASDGLTCIRANGTIYVHALPGIRITAQIMTSLANDLAQPLAMGASASAAPMPMPEPEQAPSPIVHPLSDPNDSEGDEQPEPALA